MNKQIDYTVEEKITFYENKLKIAAGNVSASKNVFETLYYANQIGWIVSKLNSLITAEKTETKESGRSLLKTRNTNSE